MRVLILSPSVTLESSGNVSTVRRIQKHFISEEIDCIVKDTSSVAQTDAVCSCHLFKKFIVESRVDGILFLHAYKSAKVLLCSCLEGGIEADPCLPPYGIIFGGTDLNLDVLDPEKYISMQKVLSTAKFAVAFNDALKEVSLKLIPHLKVFVQPQAVEIPRDCMRFNSDFNDNFLQSYCSDENVYAFVMVTGLRAVKDPSFILDDWIHWFQSSNNLNLKLIIIASVLEEAYANRFFEHMKSLQKIFGVNEALQYNATEFSGLKGILKWIKSDIVFPILYVPPLPNEQLKRLLSSSCIFASVNTSESEGMSSAVLESMVYRIPVIARDNQGNKSLIKEGETGLLFHTPEDFVSQATRLIRETGLRNKIVKNAFEMVVQHHSTDKEKEFYKNICEKYFHNSRR